MLTKLVLLLTVLANLSLLVLASPPACLLGAINEYKDPSDIEAVCKAKDATGMIAKMCGGAAGDALAAFADVCNGVGVEVSTKLPTSASASATGTGTGFPTPSGNSTRSGTGAASNTGFAPATGTPSASGAPAPEQTGAAGSVELAGGAVAFLAGLGAMLVAL